jgi:hypothetical protein
MKHCTSLVAAALAFAASLSAQTLTPRIAFLPGTAAAELRLTLAGATPSGVGAVFYAPAASGPVATPWGDLYLAPPTPLVTLPLTPVGTFAYPIPAAMPPFALALQGVTFDPRLIGGGLLLTNHALVAFDPVGVALPDPGAAGSWDAKAKKWCISCIGAPGQVVEVVLYEQRSSHIIGLWNGRLNANGELNQCGDYPPGLRAGDKIVVKIGGQTIIELK